MVRDKEATRAKILKAVEKVVSQHGFAKLGINSVAEEAGVDKVLIYRYFGGLERLLKVYAEENPISCGLPPLAWPPRDRMMLPSVITSLLLRDQLEELRRRPVVQEEIRWQLIDSNIMTTLMTTVREKMAKEYIARLPFDAEKHPDCDPGAVFALLHAGISYLVASAAKLDCYQGIDLKSARGWKRVEHAIVAIVEGYFKSHESPTSGDKPARR